MQTRPNPFPTSIMVLSSATRVIGVLVVLMALWAAIGWAVALP